MMKRLFVLVLLSVLILPISAQSTVDGLIFDASKQPIAGAIVKVKANSKVLAYGIANDKGHYSVSFTSDAKTLLLSAESLGYEPFSREILNRSQDQNVTMKEQVTALKEVVVKAPPIRQRGDTLSYNLAQFANEDDYTLRDAMKKLPGIDIGESGTIKYLGKDISNFYIDGLDLLGGKYNIATNNIPAEYVSNVQVLDHHQAAKVDKDVFSDDVAINVQLKNRARFRPMGTYEAATGYGDRWLYQLSGAGMLFKPKFQMIATLKAGNIRQFAAEEGISHFHKGETPSPVSELLGNLSASAPPIAIDRYASPTDRLLTLNLIDKVGSDETLRGNIGYGYAKSGYDYALQRNYYDGANAIIIAQQFLPLSVIHKPNFSVEYKRNATSSYISNQFSGYASFLRSELPTIENGTPLSQEQELHDYRLANDFAARWRKGGLRWSVSSKVQFLSTPTASITVMDGSANGILQTAKGTSVIARNILSTAYEWDNSRVYFPLLLNHSADRIQTARDDIYNKVSADKTTLAFAPQYEYTHPRRRYNFRAELPMRIDHMGHTDHFTDEDDGSWYFSICPSMYLNYMFNARSSFRLRTSYTRNFGDILDFLTAPVQTENTTMRIGSGILADNRLLMASAHFDYKIPLDMLFVNADIIWQRNRNNLMSSQSVSSGLVLSGFSPAPNTGNDITSQVGITKQIEPIKTKVSLRGSYLWRKQMATQNDKLFRYTWQTVALSPILYSQPLDFIELQYNGTFSKTFSRYESIRKSYLSQAHNVTLKLSPVKSLQFSIASDITSHQLTDDLTKTMALLDCGITYRHQAIRLALNLRNALNQRQYTYTVYNSINTYTYGYHLRGRELVLTFTYTR